MADAKAGEQASLSPELVRRVTDEVYKLLLRDLKQERERQGETTSGPMYGLPSRRRNG